MGLQEGNFRVNDFQIVNGFQKTHRFLQLLFYNPPVASDTGYSQLCPPPVILSPYLRHRQVEPVADAGQTAFYRPALILEGGCTWEQTAAVQETDMQSLSLHLFQNKHFHGVTLFDVVKVFEGDSTLISPSDFFGIIFITF